MRGKSKLKRLLTFLLTTVIALSYIAAVPAGTQAEEQTIDVNTVSCSQALIINTTDDMVLFDRGADQPIFCGYLPQVMTCILLLELDRDLSQQVTISKQVLQNTPQASTLNFKAGDTVSLGDLVLAALMANAQDACVAIALSISPDLDTFVGLMNEKAKQLGAEQTHFVNVQGYYTESAAQMTTLYDVAKILKYALSLKDFEKYANVTYTTVTVSGTQKQIYTRNSTIVEQGSRYYVPNLTGIGMASDSRCGSAVAGATSTKEMRVLILGQTDGALSQLYTDIKTMTEYARNSYTTRTLATAGATIRELKVTQGKDTDYVVLTAEKDVQALMANTIAQEDIETIFDVPEQVNAPIEKGQVLGTLSFVYDGYTYGTVNLTAKTSVELDMMQAFTDKINHIFRSPAFIITIIVIILLVILYTIITIHINKKRQKRRKSSKHERIKIDLD